MNEPIHIKLSYDPNIVKPKHKTIFLDMDNMDAEIISIKRNGREIVFPIWEFWQTLEKYNDCEGCEFY